MGDQILQLQMAKLHLHQMKIQMDMESNILQAPMEPNGCVYFSSHYKEWYSIHIIILALPRSLKKSKQSQDIFMLWPRSCHVHCFFKTFFMYLQ